MTLYEIIGIFKRIALTQPNIRTATDGSIYDVLNNNPSIQYDVFHIQQTTHQEDFETDYYGLTLFYDTRLDDDLESNRLLYQSTGKELLGNIIRTFCENWGIDFPTITYTPYTQRFVNLDCGVYCNIRLEVPKDIICADDYLAEVVPGSGIKLQDMGITITQNGLIVVTPGAEYDGIGEIRIETNVPQTAAELQYKEVEYTGNGEYSVRPDPAYDGLTEVAVTVDVPDRYDEGYDDGKEDGAAEQKAKLVPTAVTENGTYSRPDGFSEIVVSVPQGQGYDEGYADGEAAQKAKLVATSFTENNTFLRADGWSSVTINVPQGQGYEEGYEDGEAAQKAKLVPTAVTENGTYSRPDGFSQIVVTVPPSTAYTDLDLIANLQGDYYVIPDGTDHLRQWAFYNTCFSSITIPNSVRVINAYAFANNTCLTSMTFPSSVTAVGSYVLCGDTALEEITFERTTPPTLGNTGNSLGDTAYTFPIYVPCESIDAYKAAFGTAYATRIQCKEQPQPTGDTAITAITLVVDSAITDSGTATTTYSPIDAPTDIYYTSSDPAIARVDSGTGAITVIASGTVTICAIDRISGLQDCKTITVDLSDLSALGMAIYDVKSTSSRTEILGAEGYKSFDYMIYNGKRINIMDGATGYTFSATGRQVVYYHFRDASTLKAGAFWRGTGINNLLPLVSFTLPKSVRTIQSYAFKLTALESFNLPNTVTAITEGGQVFYQCRNLTAFTFESGSTIQKFTPALYGTKIKTISIPNSVKEVGEIQANLSLTAITLGTGVTKIQSAAFDNSISLVNVTIRATTPPTVTNNSSPFGDYPPQHIYVPANSVSAYKTTSPWSSMANIITAIP